MTAALSPQAYVALAQAVLIFHFGIVLFNLGGLILIPLGAWRGWAFIRIWWWRALHAAVLAVVAIQAVLGRACFLTLWQADLLRRAGEAGADAPLIMRIVNRLMFWPLPLWVFAVAYVTVCVLVLLLWLLVPPVRRSGRQKLGVAREAARSRR